MILVDFPIVNDYGYKGNDDEVTLKKSWCRDLKTQKELEAHLFRFRSTNEYYKCAQYEPQTLPYVWVMSDNSFRSRAHLTKASIGFGWRLRYSKFWQFMFIFWKQKFVAKKNFFLKTIFFEQSILSEVGLVSIWKESDQYNLSNERDLKHRKMIKNVSFLARLRWDRSYSERLTRTNMQHTTVLGA